MQNNVDQALEERASAFWTGKSQEWRDFQKRYARELKKQRAAARARG